MSQVYWDKLPKGATTVTRCTGGLCEGTPAHGTSAHMRALVNQANGLEVDGSLPFNTDLSSDMSRGK